MRTLTAFVLALLTAVACSSPTAPSGQSVPAGTGRFAFTASGFGGVSIGGTLFRPEIPQGQVRPAIIVIHGHLPYSTSGAATVEPIARRFSELGYISLAMSMRGWPPSGGTDDCGWHQADDVVRVVEWLKGQPNVDPSHIGVTGYSKGGQMALLSAARGADVQAIVAYYPVTDLVWWQANTDREDTKIYISTLCEPGVGLIPRSPRYQASLITPPVLLLHGDADTNVPLEHSLLMADELKAVGRPPELVIVPGAGHGFSGSDVALANSVADAFLASHLHLDVR